MAWQTPVTIPYDTTLRPATDFLPLDEGITAAPTSENEPSQVPCQSSAYMLF